MIGYFLNTVSPPNLLKQIHQKTGRGLSKIANGWSPLHHCVLFLFFPSLGFEGCYQVNGCEDRWGSSQCPVEFNGNHRASSNPRTVLISIVFTLFPSCTAYHVECGHSVVEVEGVVTRLICRNRRGSCKAPKTEEENQVLQ